MKTAAELRALTFEGLARIVDPELFPLGFRRTPKGDRYARASGPSTEKIWCSFQIRRRRERSAYLYPGLALLDRAAARAAVELCGAASRRIAGLDDDAIAAFPLKWLEPRIQDRNGWEYANWPACEKAMKAFLGLLFGRGRNMLERMRDITTFLAHLDSLSERFVDQSKALKIAGGLWLRGDAQTAARWVRRAKTAPSTERKILASLRTPPPAALLTATMAR
jgi:hypothetical protein